MTTKRDIMKIEVLATGCVRLNTTEAIIKEALSQSDVDAQVVKVLDRMEIAKSEMHMTPAVIIDGQVKAVGKVLKIEKGLSCIVMNADAPSFFR